MIMPGIRGAGLSLLVTLLLAGCATVPPLTAEQQAYFQQVQAMPTTFTVLKAEAEDAWGRAQSFIGRFSSMKIQTATDFVIQTYNPLSNAVQYGYYVTRTPMGEQMQFDVQCVTGNLFASGNANQNAKVLAYYIKTGELRPEFISR